MWVRVPPSVPILSIFRFLLYITNINAPISTIGAFVFVFSFGLFEL